MMTTITTHLSVSRGNDLTTNAAIKTAIAPGIAMDIDAFLLYAPSLMNLADAGGIKKAHEPIIIGKATKGDMPKA